MSLDFFLINQHLVPFFILFFIGGVLLVIAPLHYRWKKISISVFLTWKDFLKYSKFQKGALFFGFLFVMVGIVGAAFVSEEYGYNRIVFDIHGNKNIENSKSKLFLSHGSLNKEKRISEIRAGTTVIPGTWDWDIDNDEIGVDGKTDLCWTRNNKSERYLIPKNGAKISIVTDQTFEQIDQGYLKELTFSEERISDSESDPVITPGVVIAMITSDGNFAKVRVGGFKQLHDLKFNGAEIIGEEWKAFVLKRPNIERYHLEVDWVLFKQE